MAKALFGHIGTSDHQLVALAAEVRSLRARNAELEMQLDQACRANEQLHRDLNPILMDEHDLLTLENEPALTLT